MKDTQRSPDVAIIGAGPVGMALACELIRHGLTVRIVDKALGPKDHSRSDVLAARAGGPRPDGHPSSVERSHRAAKTFHINVYGERAGTIALNAGEAEYPAPMLVGHAVAGADGLGQAALLEELLEDPRALSRGLRTAGGSARRGP